MTQDQQHIGMIEVESLEAWWSALYEWSAGWAPGWYHRPGRTPEQHAQWEDVYDGRAYLKTPDGREWWVPVSGWMGNDWSGEEEPLHGDHALLDYVAIHVWDAEHDNSWEGIGNYCPMMLFDRRTNDPGHVFCVKCGQFISLCGVNPGFPDRPTPCTLYMNLADHVREQPYRPPIVFTLGRLEPDTEEGS